MIDSSSEPPIDRETHRWVRPPHWSMDRCSECAYTSDHPASRVACGEWSADLLRIEEEAPAVRARFRDIHRLADTPPPWLHNSVSTKLTRDEIRSNLGETVLGGVIAFLVSFVVAVVLVWCLASLRVSLPTDLALGGSFSLSAASVIAWVWFCVHDERKRKLVGFVPTLLPRVRATDVERAFAGTIVERAEEQGLLRPLLAAEISESVAAARTRGEIDAALARIDAAPAPDALASADAALARVADDLDVEHYNAFAAALSSAADTGAVDAVRRELDGVVTASERTAAEAIIRDAYADGQLAGAGELDERLEAVSQAATRDALSSIVGDLGRGGLLKA